MIENRMNVGPSKIELCRIEDLKTGEALKVTTAGLTLAVFNIDGAFYVINDACTHGPGSLSEGFIERDVVTCNFHQGKFNIRTGAVVAPPCMFPVKTYKASLENGMVCIEAQAAAGTDLP
jgi:nitrite reductase/ring-hydroxylating ferredoxin subunit